MVSESAQNLRRNLREISEHQNLSLPLREYLESYFADVELSDASDASPEELLGAALQHFRLGELRQPGQAGVALYTPDFDRHGWHSPHTVIDVVTDDMPFLVDSITMVVYRHGLVIHRLVHPLLGAERDGDGKLQRALPRGAAGSRPESWIHIEIDRVGDGELIDGLRHEIAAVLGDVRAAVDDGATMQQRMHEGHAELMTAPVAESDEAAAYLQWIAANNLVFLGYADYRAAPGESTLARVPGNSLGILRDADHPGFGRCLAGIPGAVAELAKDPLPLILVKADARATVHRAAYLDFIGVKRYDASGNIVGLRAFVGLYTAHVYHVTATEIPLLRRKIAAVREAIGFLPRSHRDKTLINVLETYPRDELIEIDREDLMRIARGIVSVYERERVRIFLRNDAWGRYVSAIVYMPRDRFDTSVRERISALLDDTLAAERVDFFIMLGEARLARLHFIARTPVGSRYRYDAEAIERQVARIVRGWADELKQNLVGHFGEERGNALLRRYSLELPLSYQERVTPASAVSDLERLEAAEGSGRVEVKLSATQADDGSHQHLKLFRRGRPRPLSAILPILENMGLTVLSEQPFSLPKSDLHIADFAVLLPDPAALDEDATRQSFVALLENLLREQAENDGFNRLVLLAGLDGRQISILRAYSRYLRQAGLPFSQAYVERCLATHFAITRRLMALFEARFSPAHDDALAKALVDELNMALLQVANPDDDRILSALQTVIEATLRTNVYQAGSDGQSKRYLSFKFSSRDIPFLPAPAPLYEIFVYSERVEGVHLRGARVARGGLRWSDRMEDFRTEVLGLVKAQMVKNAVIVPLGSKGGFVCKRLPSAADREAFQAEGIACYSTFIRGLLDLTDNLIDGRIQPPSGVRRRDGDDPYLVVAADKGTATFSDIANGIAIEYGFWLGDAFASGGSVGYDHKKMGITARGAWEAVKRHFRELGLDTQTQAFSVVGIGDMSGDVFGNGLLLSSQIRLLAAFDHRHLFLDPSPDPERSFAERQRLFLLPRSSWADYDATLISEGGAIWSRSAKSIPLSPEVRAWLGTEATQMTPPELIKTILQAPVDLLYNGGIGTYVKASGQSHQEANDRANDILRVDASQLRARVVGEGGNLGLTQRGRIEFAQNGGRIFTDAIDNSAGVDCSDHEVNIKILLAGLVGRGDMTGKQRDALLASMTDEVGRLVLIDNYQQTQAIALEAAAGAALIDVHGRLIRSLEARGALHRGIEFLPDDKGLAERAQQKRGLTAPEIAVLLAYAKIALKEAILASSLPDSEDVHDLLVNYFPAALVAHCRELLPAHPLKRDIITTQLVNRLVNRMGTTFVMQVADETGAAPAQVAGAWYAASSVLDGEALWCEIESLDLIVDASRQMELMAGLRAMTLAATRLLLTQHLAGATIGRLLADYRPAVGAAIDRIRCGQTGAQAITALIEERSAIVAAFDLVNLARVCGKPLNVVADALGNLAAQIDLDWLGGAVNHLPAGNRWQARARAQLTSDLSALRQHLLGQVLAGSLPATGAAHAVLDEIKSNEPQDLAMLSAGLAEIRRLLAS
ncbi:NAD-glutamate dehydrogenase [Accumulibacter sp.]|uniref:NAD-glutamate dehydrogenase n=1 Tax=Accumulibacter regalis TaxID=522306 RepID=C7RQT3_ACCRE|nr:NAD-glutamate dehydrogenase [Accumulibacter sp.]MBN8497348.1 NAD-glutamate dehydrogenase [Accumulibacter sp.]MBO3714404.1 NAD-glutamate dehydrogenase [Accumulibacter sp.]